MYKRVYNGHPLVYRLYIPCASLHILLHDYRARIGPLWATWVVPRPLGGCFRCNHCFCRHLRLAGLSAIQVWTESTQLLCSVLQGGEDDRR